MLDGAQIGKGTFGRIVPGPYSVSVAFDVGVGNGGWVDCRTDTSPFRFSRTLNWVRFDLH